MLNEQEKMEAEMNYTPQKPRKHELGGDYYYKCRWLNCDADINKWFNYCPICGQRIDWSDE